MLSDELRAAIDYVTDPDADPLGLYMLDPDPLLLEAIRQGWLLDQVF